MDLKSLLQLIDGDLIVEDRRTAHMYLMGSWWPTLLMCIAYYVIVVRMFSSYMRKRAALEVRFLLIAYNATMVLWSLYMCVAFLLYGIRTGGSLSCWTLSGPDDEHGGEGGLHMAGTFWWFYVSKLAELFDTAFFVARRRWELVTVLHVYHHMVMPATTWLAVKYSPGGFMAAPFGLNCLVHVFMYAYYGMAAAGLHRLLWWKRYLTVAQMTQFVVIIIHSLYFLSLDCRYPRGLVFIILVNAVIFLVLFLNYFLRARRPGMRQSPQAEQQHRHQE